MYVHPKNIIGAIVDRDDVTKIIAWQVRKNIRKATASYGTPVTGHQETQTEIVPANEIIRFTLNDDMDDTAPFGESILRPVYRSQKQKERCLPSVLKCILNRSRMKLSRRRFHQ